MPRQVTVTFLDGSKHTYQNVPDEVTSAQVMSRAKADFTDKSITKIDAATAGAPEEERGALRRQLEDVYEKAKAMAPKTPLEFATLPTRTAGGAAEAVAAGVYGLGTEAVGGLVGGVRMLASPLTGEPPTEAFQAGLDATREIAGSVPIAPETAPGQLFESVLGLPGAAFRSAGEGSYNVTGSPVIGAGVETALNAAALVVGGRGARPAVRQGARVEPSATAVEAISSRPTAAPAVIEQASRQSEAVAQSSRPVVADPTSGPAAVMPLDELAATTKSAASGKDKPLRALAEQTMPDPRVVEAAKRLGIEEHLQPDHVSTNQSYRELSQAIKSFPGSELRAQELAGLERVAQRADALIEEAGGTKDMSTLSERVKADMQRVQKELEDKADAMYGDLRAKVDPTMAVEAPGVLDFISRRSKELGGDKYLTATERQIKSALNDKAKPTYARLDDIRRELTAARVKKEGAFKDADTGLIKKLESELKNDQRSALEQLGLVEDFDLAQRTVSVRKGLEDDMTALFGKELEGSITRSLDAGVKGLAKGDVSKFEQTINAIPENMRKQAVASGLAYAFERNAGAINHTSFAKWYEGVKQNRRAYAALSKNLDMQTMKSLDRLYRVSNGIRSASRERIQTGRLQVVKEELRDADTAVGKLYAALKDNAVKTVAAEAISSSMGLPGAGFASAVTAALTKEKTPAYKAADQLLASEAFNETVKKIADGTTKKSETAAKVVSKRLEKAPEWKRYLEMVGRNQQRMIRQLGAVAWLTAGEERPSSRRDRKF